MWNRCLLVTALVFGVGLGAGCGSDDDGDTCLPQGAVSVGAVGTIGPPLTDYADCYSGAMPAISLDGERTATVTGTTVSFDAAGLEATVDADCRVSITYSFDSMFSDGTPNTGTAVFAADPDPNSVNSWTEAPQGSIIFEWDDGLDGAVCGNRVADAIIVVQAR